MLEFLNPLFFEGCAIAFDIPILYWIQEHLRCAFLDVFMPFITLFGDGGIFWICWAALLLLFPKHRKTGLAMGIALILGVIVCNMFLKTQIARPRPYDFIENFDMSMLLVHEHGDKSFPSGHTTAAFAAMDPAPARYYHTRLDTHENLDLKTIEASLDICLNTLFLYGEKGLNV